MSRKKRIERHVREAMVHHLGDDETVVATVFGPVSYTHLTLPTTPYV